MRLVGPAVARGPTFNLAPRRRGRTHQTAKLGASGPSARAVARARRLASTASGQGPLGEGNAAPRTGRFPATPELNESRPIQAAVYYRPQLQREPRPPGCHSLDRAKSEEPSPELGNLLVAKAFQPATIVVVE